MGAALLESLLDDAPLYADGAITPVWLSDMRRAAAMSLVRDGMPAPRSESWKYTSLRALERRKFVRGDRDAAERTVDPSLFKLPGADGPRMVFVNGVFRADLSRLPEVPGLSLQALGSVLHDNPDSLQAILGNGFDDSAQPFARLNAALASDGPVLQIAEGVQLHAPIHLVFVGAETPKDVAWQARAVVIIGAGGHAHVIEHHVGEAGVAHLGNVVVNYCAKSQAYLDVTQIQNAPETTLLMRRSEVAIDAGARVRMHSLELGANLMRHDLAVDLAGDRAAFESRGVFALRGRQHADTRMDVRHVARDTTSDILWRGVADQRSRGVFHGGITILAGADGSDAQLANKNLLLSAQAEIDTQPVLEIHADEVKAAHGATVGQLDENALFYLRSRGLSADAARHLLTLAFCRVAIESLDNDALREHVDGLLLDRLPDAEA